MSGLEAAVFLAWFLGALILLGLFGSWLAGFRTAEGMWRALGLDPDLPVSHVRVVDGDDL